MSKPFDAVLKDIVRRHVADYAAAFRLPHAAVVLNVDLSTVTAATDVVLADSNPPRVGLTTLDFQAGHDSRIDNRALLYQALLRSRYGLPVHSVVLLLRPDAYRLAMTGSVRYEAAGGRGKMDFRYELVRLWEVPAPRLLGAGIGISPLAVLGAVPGRRPAEAALADVVRELDRRYRTEASSAEAEDLMTAAFVLTGLRLPDEVGAAIFQRVLTMHESTTYQRILREGQAIGEVVGARATLLALAKRALGRPPKKALAAFEQITDRDRLARMSEALLDVKSWDDLLAIE